MAVGVRIPDDFRRSVEASLGHAVRAAVPARRPDHLRTVQGVGALLPLLGGFFGGLIGVALGTAAALIGCGIWLWVTRPWSVLIATDAEVQRLETTGLRAGSRLTGRVLDTWTPGSASIAADAGMEDTRLSIAGRVFLVPPVYSREIATIRRSQAAPPFTSDAST